MKYRTAVFDMDGTILDTVGDLQDAINHSFGLAGHKNDFSYDDTKLLFGSGVKAAIQRGLAIEAGAPYELLEKIGESIDAAEYGVTPEETKKIQTIYAPYYNEHCLIKTGPYDGIRDTLRELRARGILTAVVSNKPDAAVQSLVNDLFDGLFDYSEGEKDGIRRKPAPDMVLASLSFLKTEKKDAVYVGDSEIDMLTAANSGLDFIGVSWGFRGEQFLKDHGAGVIACNSKELTGFIVGEKN